MATPLWTGARAGSLAKPTNGASNRDFIEGKLPIDKTLYVCYTHNILRKQTEGLIMAYMGQEKKAEIREELKKVMPKTWKWSLGVHHHSTIVLNISAAPVNLVKEVVNHKLAEPSPVYKPDPNTTSWQVNEYHLDTQFSGKRLETFKKIKAALNKGNHDNSNPQVDHFDVGWYVSINLGRFDKPFEVRR